MEVLLHIMIIDDSPIILDRLTPTIQALPNVEKVSQGSNYRDGLKLLSEHKIDVAILDINMPGKNGIELLRYIKENETTQSTVVLMITEEATEVKKTLSFSAKADYFIDKFENFEKIIDIITELPSPLPGRTP